MGYEKYYTLNNSPSNITAKMCSLCLESQICGERDQIEKKEKRILLLNICTWKIIGITETIQRPCNYRLIYLYIFRTK